MTNTKIQYQFGDCVPVSELAYKRLKNKGYNPILVAGFVSVIDSERQGGYYQDKFKHKL